MGCLDDDTLLALTERTLTPQEQEAVNSHLDHCARCLRLVANAMRALAAPPPEEVKCEGPALVPGARIDRYVIVEQVGTGATGEVYAAEDTKLKRKVALKVLPAKEARSSEHAQFHMRMWKEAQALAQLSHPSIVSVFDAFTFGECVIIVMEYVPGGTVRRWLAERAPSWQEIVLAFLPVGRGLAAAHDTGFVHRDVKPDNMLIGADGKARISDFGLASAVLDEPAPRAGSSIAVPKCELTTTGVVVGTPAYMAPDQLEGARALPASDQFSFAVSLHEALYGERPFRGASRSKLIAEIRARRVCDPPPRSHVPSSVRRVLLRALAPRPEDRFPSMQALLLVLERASRRTGRWVLATLAAVLALAALVSVVQHALPRPCPPPDPLLEAVWDEPQKRALRATLAAESAVEVDRTLSEYLAEWSRAYKEACKATWIDHQQPKRVFFARMTCMNGLLERVKAEVGALPQAGNARALRASLPAVNSCAASRF